MIQHFDAGRANQFLHEICNIGPRLVGTKEDLESITYISDKYCEFGLEGDVDKFEAPAFEEKEAKIEIIRPYSKLIQCRAVFYSASTLSLIHI